MNEKNVFNALTSTLRATARERGLAATPSVSLRQRARRRQRRSYRVAGNASGTEKMPAGRSKSALGCLQQMTVLIPGLDSFRIYGINNMPDPIPARN